jgi:hypothetical protein
LNLQGLLVYYHNTTTSVYTHQVNKYFGRTPPHSPPNVFRSNDIHSTHPSEASIFILFSTICAIIVEQHPVTVASQHQIITPARSIVISSLYFAIDLCKPQIIKLGKFYTSLSNILLFLLTDHQCTRSNIMRQSLRCASQSKETVSATSN